MLARPDGCGHAPASGVLAAGRRQGSEHQQAGVAGSSLPSPGMRPGIRLTGLAAGFHAVAHLPGPADEQAVITGAAERLVGLYGMADYRAARVAGPPQLVMGFGNVRERAIEPGIAAVAELLG